MNQPVDHPLYSATRRLLAALEQLELNLQHVTVGQERELQQQQHLLHYERENASLRQEREQLHGTISQLQQQYEELQGVASTIYGKLDATIDRLSQILEK